MSIPSIKESFLLKFTIDITKSDKESPVTKTERIFVVEEKDTITNTPPNDIIKSEGLYIVPKENEIIVYLDMNHPKTINDDHVLLKINAGKIRRNFLLKNFLR
jgi:hypothetical protein